MRAASGAVFSPRLGLHVHVAMRELALVGVRLSSAPPPAPPHPDALPLLRRIEAHLAGARDDLRDVPIRLEGLGDFQRRALEALREDIGPGTVTTYGELARRVGAPGAARAVGGAMARNPIPLVVPCHRVLPSGRAMGSYSGEGGVDTKRALLRIEGALWF